MIVNDFDPTSIIHFRKNEDGSISVQSDDRSITYLIGRCLGIQASNHFSYKTIDERT